MLSMCFGERNGDKFGRARDPLAHSAGCGVQGIGEGNPAFGEPKGALATAACRLLNRRIIAPSDAFECERALCERLCRNETAGEKR